MKIWKFLPVEHIFLDVSLTGKQDTFQFIAGMCQKKGIVKNASQVLEGMTAREATASTGVGLGIGLPHTTSSEIKDPSIILIRAATPIDFDALDGLSVDIILALLIPEGNTALHLRILAGISRLCKNENFLKTIRQATDSQALRDEIVKIEEEMAFH